MKALIGMSNLVLTSDHCSLQLGSPICVTNNYA